MFDFPCPFFKSDLARYAKKDLNKMCSRKQIIISYFFRVFRFQLKESYQYQNPECTDKLTPLIISISIKVSIGFCDIPRCLKIGIFAM